MPDRGKKGRGERESKQTKKEVGRKGPRSDTTGFIMNKDCIRRGRGIRTEEGYLSGTRMFSKRPIVPRRQRRNDKSQRHLPGPSGGFNFHIKAKCLCLANRWLSPGVCEGKVFAGSILRIERVDL